MNDATSKFAFRIVGEEGIGAVQPLWEKLKAHHYHFSPHFTMEMHSFTFQSRKQEILAKAALGKLRVELVTTASSPTDVAYCVSTLSMEGRGEVDSIFVEECFRGCGIGTELLRRAMTWLDSMGASSKVVTVAYANSRAIALYLRFGFSPRTILLQQSPISVVSKG